MLFDAHVHTIHSCDADTTLADAIQIAHEKQIGLVITDHMDVDFPIPPPDFRLDVPRFFREALPHRSSRVLLGIELGMTEKSLEENRKIIRSHDFDFVLGSVHVLYGREVDDALYADKDERAVYLDYLHASAALLRELPVDAFAHVDYPLRTTAAELPFADYREAFAALFDVLIARGIVLELNTSRLNQPAAYRNLLEIYRAYHARGGRYVTLGSDAHEPQEIADNFALAQAFLQETRLLPVHFVRREMIVDQP